MRDTNHHLRHLKTRMLDGACRGGCWGCETKRKYGEPRGKNRDFALARDKQLRYCFGRHVWLYWLSLLSRVADQDKLSSAPSG